MDPARNAGQMVAPFEGMLLHAGIGGLAAMGSNDTGRIDVEFTGQACLFKLMPEHCFGAG